MERTRGPEITFTVHPRQEVEEVIGRADPLPISVRFASTPPLPMLTPSLPVLDEPDDGDTFLGNLMFLARFAFGRY